MRIIAGKFKSRRLKTLKGDNTRPSSDRLKEAMFNQIGPYFDCGTLLDVFAGSGAIGFEALSRGMDKVTLIEKNRKAASIINQNIKALNIKNEVNLINGDALAVLKTIDETYDIIFIDPPYGFEKLEDVALLASKLLNENGTLLIETDKFTDVSKFIGKLTKTKEKQYGFVKLHTYEMS